MGGSVDLLHKGGSVRGSKHVSDLGCASGSSSDLLLCRCGNATTALLMATSSGLLGAAVVAADISPQWAESEPFCISDGAELTSVRSEVVPPQCHACATLRHGPHTHCLWGVVDA